MVSFTPAPAGDLRRNGTEQKKDRKHVFLSYRKHVFLSYRKHYFLSYRKHPFLSYRKHPFLSL